MKRRSKLALAALAGIAGMIVFANEPVLAADLADPSHPGGELDENCSRVGLAQIRAREVADKKPQPSIGIAAVT
jgi:hypothetical protein